MSWTHGSNAACLLFIPDETRMKRWISWPHCEINHLWLILWSCVNWLFKYIFIQGMVCVLTASYFLLCCLIHHLSRPTVDLWVRLDLQSALYLHSSPVVIQAGHTGQHALSVFDFPCLPCVKPMRLEVMSFVQSAIRLGQPLPLQSSCIWIWGSQCWLHGSFQDHLLVLIVWKQKFTLSTHALILTNNGGMSCLVAL